MATRPGLPAAEGSNVGPPPEVLERVPPHQREKDLEHDGEAVRLMVNSSSECRPRLYSR
jgi:hypothetical protein